MLNVAFGEPTIAVDTHIFRVANRTGMAPGADPRAVEDGLLKVVPEGYLDHAHHWLILHGRYVCVARKPLCPECIILDLCRYGAKTPPGRRWRKPRRCAASAPRYSPAAFAPEPPAPMPEPRYDVLGIGNAIVDVMAPIEDDFLADERLAKGTMHLIDAERAETLHRAIPGAIERSGGSAGNTAAGVASLGGRAAFIGKVADDPLGRLYRSDMRATGVAFATAPLAAGAPTARSMILITPDGERTMNTYLGACQMLSPADIDPAVVGAAAITYLEGYLWDPPQAKEAFRHAAKIAHQAGRKVSLTLSDAFCVDRFRAEFKELIRFRHGRHSVRQRPRAEVALHHGKSRCRRRRRARRLRPDRRHGRGRGRAGW